MTTTTFFFWGVRWLEQLPLCSLIKRASFLVSVFFLTNFVHVCKLLFLEGKVQQKPAQKHSKQPFTDFLLANKISFNQENKLQSYDWGQIPDYNITKIPKQAKKPTKPRSKTTHARSKTITNSTKEDREQSICITEYTKGRDTCRRAD